MVAYGYTETAAALMRSDYSGSGSHVDHGVSSFALSQGFGLRDRHVQNQSIHGKVFTITTTIPPSFATSQTPETCVVRYFPFAHSFIRVLYNFGVLLLFIVVSWLAS